jgi:hypothetical protein
MMERIKINIIRVIKSREIRLAEHIAHMGQM